jgi:hypothetical protein
VIIIIAIKNINEKASGGAKPSPLALSCAELGGVYQYAPSNSLYLLKRVIVFNQRHLGVFSQKYPN